MIRQLDQDEKAFIGQGALLLIITILPFGMFMDATQIPVDNWGKSIIASGINKDHPAVVQQAILFLIIDYGKVFLLFPLVFMNFRIIKKFGFNQDIPMRWQPYVSAGFKKKKDNKK